MLGQTVMEETVNACNHMIQLSQLNSGIYYAADSIEK